MKSRRTSAERLSLSALPSCKAALLTVFLVSAFCVLPTAFSALAQINPVPSETTPSPAASPTPAPSPTPPPNLHQWGAVTLFHGLPSDRVHAIAQTPDGALWFATDGGLAKYDGRRIQAITADSLPPGRVLTLRIDDDGALWVGTENGAARFVDGSFVEIKETGGKVITAIISPQRGRALMATENGVIFDCQVKQGAASSPSATTRSEPGPSSTMAVVTIPNEPLSSYDKDHPGSLKITSLAMVGGVVYAGTQSRGILAIENGEAKEVPSKPRSYFINALEVDSQGRLWSGAKTRGDDGGLFDQSDPVKPDKASSATGPVTAISRGAHEDIWVGSDGNGAFHIDGGKQIEHFTFEGTGGALRSDHLFAIFVDREEVVWFGTDKGVCRYDPHAMRTESISGDPSTNYVRSLLRTSRGRLVAGTNSGLFAYEPASKTWQPIAELGRRIIYAVSEDANHRVIVATANGLFAAQSSGELAFARIQPTSEKLPQGDNVRAITTVAGVTYVATFGYGVEKLQGSQRSLVWPDANADAHLREITGLGKDQSDRLLIGTAGAGVFVFDGKQMIAEAAFDKLKGGAVWSIASDESGTWLATDKGLFLLQAGQLRDIVPGVIARHIVISTDSNNSRQVWCATVGNGLFKITLDDQLGPIVSRMDVEQGLPSQRVFAVLPERANDGADTVVIATNRGITRYEPGRMPPALSAERIISKRIHGPEELRTGLQLDYPQNSLLLDVTANSSRTFPEQFLYAFVLYDAAGHSVKQKLSHDAQFAMEGLKAGKYKVVARAFTKDLVASTPLSFEFSVARAPFPWTSTALAVLLLLALVALGWGYFQNRRIHRASAELASTNRELAEARLQLANETEAERRRIARDLHDQTLADLRNLMLMTDELSTAKEARPPLNTLRAEIESISQEVRLICEDLSPSALENVGLSAALQYALAHAVEHAAPDCKFEYEFVCDDALDEKLKLPANAQIQIYRIAQEALSNICRHAQASRVSMSAAVTDSGEFELTVSDNGRGFDRSDARNNAGRGVANIRARASMIDAEVEWGKRDGGGTVFTLQRKGAGAGPLPDLRDDSN